MHEIGHILGLAHSDVEGAVMFTSIASNFIKRALTPDDIAGVEDFIEIIKEVKGTERSCAS